MARRGGRIPGQFATVEQRQALLDEMIQQRAALAQARRDSTATRSTGRPRMLTTQYLRTHLDPELEKIEVTAAEVAAFYQAHREEFLTPARIRAAWIFLAVSAKADAAQVEKTRLRLVAARDEAAKLPPETRNFGEIAKRYSEDAATRYVGGELGWIYEGQAESYRLGAEGPPLRPACARCPFPRSAVMKRAGTFSSSSSAKRPRRRRSRSSRQASAAESRRSAAKRFGRASSSAFSPRCR